MSDGQALLAAVIADPDDDAVRLVYADWLDENGGEPRAEFIRSQVRRERLKRRDPKRATMEARERELLAEHAAEWLKPLPKWARPSGDELIADEAEWFGFRRGFLQGAIMSHRDTFLAEAPAAFAIEPITHLYLADRAALPKLAKCPQFVGLTGLRFSHYTLGDRGCTTFARLPPMPRLRHLRMYKNEIGDAGLKRLAGWPGLATLREWMLTFNDFTDASVQALIDSPHLTSIEDLDMSDSDLGAAAKAALRARFGKAVSF